MTELEREMELADRGEKRDDLLERRKLLQKQRQAERKQKPPARKVPWTLVDYSCHSE